MESKQVNISTEYGTLELILSDVAGEGAYNKAVSTLKMNFAGVWTGEIKDVEFSRIEKGEGWESTWARGVDDSMRVITLAALEAIDNNVSAAELALEVSCEMLHECLMLERKSHAKTIAQRDTARATVERLNGITLEELESHMRERMDRDENPGVLEGYHYLLEWAAQLESLAVGIQSNAVELYAGENNELTKLMHNQRLISCAVRVALSIGGEHGLSTATKAMLYGDDIDE